MVEGGADGHDAWVEHEPGMAADVRNEAPAAAVMEAEARDSEEDGVDVQVVDEREFLADSLRTYLFEIGRAKLLSGAAERSLGRKLETAAYLHRTEQTGFG